MKYKPKAILFLNYDVNLLLWVREHLPETFVVGRFYQQHQPLGNDIKQASELGSQFAERIFVSTPALKTHNGRLLFDAWISYNEVVGTGSSEAEHRRYDSFQVGFARRMKIEGLIPIGFNFATGNMDPGQMIFYEETVNEYDYLGFHEYSWPTMEEGETWLALRYRRLMDPIKAKYGKKHKILITECGLTQGTCYKNIDNPSQGKGEDIGWLSKKLTVDPRYKGTLSLPLPTDHYVSAMKRYFLKLKQDPQVRHAFIFCVGADSARWESFETVNILEKFK